jgi:hypothetical protein
MCEFRPLGPIVSRTKKHQEGDGQIAVSTTRSLIFTTLNFRICKSPEISSTSPWRSYRKHGDLLTPNLYPTKHGLLRWLVPLEPERMMPRQETASSMNLFSTIVSHRLQITPQLRNVIYRKTTVAQETSLVESSIFH